MDIQKAIDTLNHLVLCGSCTTGPCKDCDRKNAKDTAIQGLRELQQYLQIGTVDECRAARERVKPKHPKLVEPVYKCPTCGSEVHYDYCQSCGQALKWVN